MAKAKAGSEVSCNHCGNAFYRYPSETKEFCSHSCASDAKRKHPKEPRECKLCHSVFEYCEKPSSNSSGAYCSLECRNEAYSLNAVRVTRKKLGYPRWRSVRNRFFAKGNNFCCTCGKTAGRLSVHHIEPNRINRRSDDGNLVTLCGKCHSREERLSTLLALLPEGIRNEFILLKKADLHDQWHLWNGRRLLSEAV